MRICVVLSDFQAGGAQRVMATLLRAWTALGHEVALATFDNSANDFYDLPVGAMRFTLGGLTPSRFVWTSIFSNVRRIAVVRKAVQIFEPDVVLAFIDRTNILSILATRPLRIPIIVSERIYPPAFRLGLFWGALRLLSYPYADAVVMQTHLGGKWARRFVRSDRVSVIPNPIDERFTAIEAPPLSRRKKQILAAGRLVKQKGFDVLIGAFSRSQAVTQGWTLKICGSGPEASNLHGLAQSSGVSRNIAFAGVCSELRDEFLAAQLFVLSSRFEGFPNVLLEAMASGCAVVSTDCRSGPSEIVTPGVDGLLVQPDNEESLRQAIDRLIADDSLRQELGNRALAVRNRFAASAIAFEWLNVFQRALFCYS